MGGETGGEGEEASTSVLQLLAPAGEAMSSRLLGWVLEPARHQTWPPATATSCASLMSWWSTQTPDPTCCQAGPPQVLGKGLNHHLQ